MGFNLNPINNELIAYIFVLIAACMLGDKTSIIQSIFLLVAILTCIGINVVSKDVGMSLFFIVIGISEVVNAIITLASTGEGIYFLSHLLFQLKLNEKYLFQFSF